MCQISVITCLYNTSPQLFQNCLLGLKNQTFTDFEVLIVDDGSTEYLEENKKLIENLNDKRFKFFETEHTGKSQTLNFALYKATGKYIAINDSDDISLPERLEYQYKFLEKNYDKYDLISNAMVSDPYGIIFPHNFESGKVTKNNLNYYANHPSQMFKRHKVLTSVPFLFEQIYDSMEDNVFNHIMFYSGIRMYYDNEVLMRYSQLNNNAVHYQNTYGYKKEGSTKLFHNTFYVKHNKPNLTCFLLINKWWTFEEIEKTIINIRFTAYEVSIKLILYDNINNDYLNSFIEKYDIQIHNAINICDAINKSIELSDTENIMYISKPIRFYTQNWDLYIKRVFNIDKGYNFIQPYMTGIYKIDRNNYYNENGKDKTYNIRYGEYVTLMTNKLSHKNDYMWTHSEYTDKVEIPVIDDDLVFITTKSQMNKIIGTQGFDNDILLNVFLSLKQQTRYGGNIFIDFNIKCGVIDNFKFNNYDEHDYEYHYYLNLYKIAHIFLHETKIIYEKILNEKYDRTIVEKIINTIVNDNKINELKCQINTENEFYHFLKKCSKNNLKYSIWNINQKL
jgi:glycosyltransferase involved in cell wall biosynthesis